MDSSSTGCNAGASVSANGLNNIYALNSANNSLLKSRNVNTPVFSVPNGGSLPITGAKTTTVFNSATGTAVVRSGTVIASASNLRTVTVFAAENSSGTSNTEASRNPTISKSYIKSTLISTKPNSIFLSTSAAGNNLKTNSALPLSVAVSSRLLPGQIRVMNSSDINAINESGSESGFGTGFVSELNTNPSNNINADITNSSVTSNLNESDSVDTNCKYLTTCGGNSTNKDSSQEIAQQHESTKNRNFTPSIMANESENSIGFNNNNVFDSSNTNVIESARIITEMCPMDESANGEMTQIEEHNRDSAHIIVSPNLESANRNDVLLCSEDIVNGQANGMPSFNTSSINRSDITATSVSVDVPSEHDAVNLNSDHPSESPIQGGSSISASTATTSAMNADAFYNNDGDLLYGTVLSAESIKVIAESMGISALPDDAAKELAEDITIKIKRIVQDGLKFMYHSKRERLLLTDLDNALRMRNLEPQYGFVSNEFTPFRFASGGGRELHFVEEKEIDLADITQVNSLKLPIEPTIRTHWLAVDGVQPTIPENPPPLSKEVQSAEAVNPIVKLDHNGCKDIAGKPAIGKLQKLRNVETVHVKQLATHELSVEQQLYYKEITEACVGADESRRGEALQSLACDPGLYEMLPRMCTFIAEGVKVNVVQTNLAILIYLMRMVKALLDNPTLYLEKYLHELIPSVLTCIVTRQLCTRPELDNHWALRDFASRLMSQICKTFNTSTNDLQTRVTRVFSKALVNDKIYLSSLYGSLTGLSELGPEVIKVFIIPRLKFISERLEGHFHGTAQSSTEKTAAGHIRAMLQKVCAPILKQMRQPPDLPEEYKLDFGVLGPSLCQTVMKSRNSGGSVASFAQSMPTLPSPYFPSMIARQSVGQFVTNKQMSSPAISTNRIPLQCQAQNTPQQAQTNNSEDMDVCSLNTSNNYNVDSSNVSIQYRRESGENLTANTSTSTNSNSNKNTNNNKTINNLKSSNNSNNNKINNGNNNNTNKNSSYSTDNYGGNSSHANNNNTINNSVSMNNTSSNNDMCGNSSSRVTKNNNINKNYNSNNTSGGINKSNNNNNNRNSTSNDNLNNNNSGSCINSTKGTTGIGKNTINYDNNNSNKGTVNSGISNSNKNFLNSPNHNPINSPITYPINHASNNSVNNPNIYGSNSSNNNSNSAGNVRDNGTNMNNNNNRNNASNSNPIAHHFNSNVILPQSSPCVHLHTVVINNTIANRRQPDSNSTSMNTND